MAASTKEMRHADEPSAVPAWSVDAGILELVRHRRAGEAALIALRGPRQLRAAQPTLLAVRWLPVPVQRPQWHNLRVQ